MGLPPQSFNFMGFSNMFRYKPTILGTSIHGNPKWPWSVGLKLGHGAQWRDLGDRGGVSGPWLW